MIEENYKAIVARGLITDRTNEFEFINKINEEFKELKLAFLHEDLENKKEEMADIILVVMAYAKHHNIDIESELWKKININFERSK